MDRAELYRRNADQADRQAVKARSDMERRAFEEIAKGWRELEEQALLAAKVGR